MRRWAIATTALVLLSVGGLAATAPGGDADDVVRGALAEIRPEGLRAHMRFLADDALEGRGTGTRGYDLAAKFVAAELEAMGVEPAGDNGTFLQSVPFRSFSALEDQTTLSLVREGREERLAFPSDFLSRGDASRAETSVEAPVVYVGFGVTAPDQGYDDYKNVDARGKIVAMVFGAPKTFEPALRAHYASRDTKRENASLHGAVGLLALQDEVLEGMYPYAVQVRDLHFPHLNWLDADGTPADAWPALKAEAVLSQEGVSKLLAGSGHTREEVYSLAKAGTPKSFPIPLVARLKISSKLADLKSPNVVGKITGSDPVLRSEYVVYTAHLDHLGVGEAVAGDTIYNGALDNASGTACLLEIARAFARMPLRPKRSLLFVSVTGEEAGLRGSDYFARHPTVPAADMVADINMDEDLMFWPLKDLIVHGAEHSTLGRVADEAASQLGLVVTPDNQPEQVHFVRSDQYSFVKRGIPSIAGKAGQQTTDPRLDPKKIEENWEKTVYHKPQDDMSQPFDFEAGAQYARFHWLCGYKIAQEAARPRWNPLDFFGRTYAPPGR